MHIKSYHIVSIILFVTVAAISQN